MRGRMHGLLEALVFCYFAISIIVGKASSCIPEERDVLLSFKAGVADPGDKLRSWQGQDCCNWSGVACSKKTLHVIRLDVSQYGLKGQGEINSSLAALTRLACLDLSNNYFGGLAIPEFLGSFKKLRYLDLSRANFAGKVPQLGNLSTLEHGVDLSGNQLTGEIPKEIGALSSLRILNLSRNHISGIIPEEIGNLSSLETLDLSQNGLSGPIPLSIANLIFLSWLDLSYNDLSGRIPTGCQLRTFPPSIYEGNADLCGPPSSTVCSRGNPFASILSPCLDCQFGWSKFGRV